MVKTLEKCIKLHISKFPLYLMSGILVPSVRPKAVTCKQMVTLAHLQNIADILVITSDFLFHSLRRYLTFCAHCYVKFVVQSAYTNQER